MFSLLLPSQPEAYVGLPWTVCVDKASDRHLATAMPPTAPSPPTHPPDLSDTTIVKLYLL